MGRGTLIIRYTDERGVKHDPEIYTNYLEANAKTSADTVVKLFEEGDYEVALDYEIKKTPRVVAGVEIISPSDETMRLPHLALAEHCPVTTQLPIPASPKPSR